MNTANLQLEGILMTLSALMKMLRDKGLVSEGDIEAALREAEQSTHCGRGRTGDISPSNAEAILFPIRFLQVALSQDAAGPQTFSKIAAAVGGSPRPVFDD